MSLAIQIIVPKAAEELGWKLPELVGVRVGILNGMVFITVKNASEHFDVDATPGSCWELGKDIEYFLRIAVWGSKAWEIDENDAGLLEIEIHGEEVNEEGLVVYSINNDEADVIFVPCSLIRKRIKFQETKIDESVKEIRWNWT